MEEEEKEEKEEEEASLLANNLISNALARPNPLLGAHTTYQNWVYLLYPSQLYSRVLESSHLRAGRD